MKKNSFLLFIFISIQSFGQLYVGTNTPVYVKNQVLYVKQDINLASNSNLYLRNNSQLVQGTTGLSANTGTGIVSVYQEGTSDNFEYNYWCSPVGNPVVSASNTNFGITLLNRPTTAVGAVPATILPMSNYNGTASPLAIAAFWIYKLSNANNYSQWVQVGSATTIAPGEGFTMKGTSGTDTADPESTGVTNNPGTGTQRYDFRGKPNDGTITVAVGPGNAATLTGNPYPSALDLNAFLLDALNSTCTRVAYFWEQDKNVNSHYLADYRGGYGTYSPGSLGSNGIYVAATFNSYNPDGTLNTAGTSSGLVIQRRYSPIGQGFLVNGTGIGVVTFNNSHRVFYKEGLPLTQFAKHSLKNKDNASVQQEENENRVISHFKINTIINNQFTRQLALAFMPEASDGIDAGIDALNMDPDLPNDVSFGLENDNYVIQGVNFEVSKKIPLSVKATTNTTLKFYIPEIINFDSSQNIYLFDEFDSSCHDIKNGMYEVTVAPGVYPDRFKIVFTQTLGIKEEAISNFYIVQDNTRHVLKASNPDNIAVTSFQLFDILGRTVLTGKDLGIEAYYDFSTLGISSGVYIATFLTADNKKITQKIVISNSGNH